MRFLYETQNEFYDRYAKGIRSTGYERSYEETFSRADLPSLKLTAN